MFNHINFPKIPLPTNPHTTLHRARKRGVVVNATHMVRVLASNPKRTLLLRTIVPSAENWHHMVVVSVVVVGVIFFVP